MSSKTYPKISIVIPVKNDAKGLENCLISIKRQTYPQDKLEIIVIDDRSIDNTVQIANKYKATVLMNEYHGKKIINRSETGKAIGLHHATGQFLYILEQDIEIAGEDFFQKLVYPLVNDAGIAASFAREGLPNNKMTWVTRFISYHPIQCDPMYEFFSTSIESRIIEKRKGYWLLKYDFKNVPPAGRMLFRIKLISENECWNWPGFFDLDSVCALVKAGHSQFAFVPDAGIYHYHAKTLQQLIFKRIRNLNYHFFPYMDTSYFSWFDIKSKKGIAKIFIWVLYANLFFPAMLKGIYKSLKYKDVILLAEPIIAILTTDVLIWSFIKSKSGRNLISSMLKNLFVV